jgi:hypothetical protein
MFIIILSLTSLFRRYKLFCLLPVCVCVCVCVFLTFLFSSKLPSALLSLRLKKKVIHFKLILCAELNSVTRCEVTSFGSESQRSSSGHDVSSTHAQWLHRYCYIRDICHGAHALMLCGALRPLGLDINMLLALVAYRPTFRATLQQRGWFSVGLSLFRRSGT